MGVTVHLVRGEFDDHLKWPFRGSLTFMLLDQEGDGHIVKVVPFNDTVPDKVAERAVTGERNISGQGFYYLPLFLTLSHDT